MGTYASYARFYQLRVHWTDHFQMGMSEKSAKKKKKKNVVLLLIF